MNTYTETGAHSKARCTTLYQNRKATFICFMCTLALFQYNFDVQLVNTFQAMPGFLAVFGFPSKTAPNGYGIDPTFQSLITSLLNVGQVISSVSIGLFSRRFGRRMGFWAGSACIIVGIIIQMTVTSAGAFYVGRLLLGFGNGIFVNMCLLYIAEASPAHLRGTYISMYQTTQNFGALLGSIIANFTSKMSSRLSYQIPAILLFIVPVTLSLFMLWLPESPRWLVLHGRHEEALKSLRFIRGSSLPDELILEEMDEITQVCEAENASGKSISILDSFRGHNLRRTGIAIGSALTHQATGLLVLVGYATYVFQVSGMADNAFLYTVILNLVQVVTAFFGLFAIRRYGRRPIMITGASLMTLTMFLIPLLWTVGRNNVFSDKDYCGNDFPQCGILLLHHWTTGLDYKQRSTL